MPRGTPEAVLQSIVDGINAGDMDSLMTLYEPGAVFATEPGKLTDGLPGIREALSSFVAAKGRLDLKVTRVLEGGDLALVIGVCRFWEPDQTASLYGYPRSLPMFCVVKKMAPGASYSTTLGERTDRASTRSQIESYPYSAERTRA
jgi:ketosteroid isomerase-like protein